MINYGSSNLKRYSLSCSAKSKNIKSIQTFLVSKKEITLSQYHNLKFKRLLASFITSTGSSFRIVENKSFEELISYFLYLHKIYKDFNVKKL